MWTNLWLTAGAVSLLLAPLSVTPHWKQPQIMLKDFIICTSNRALQKTTKFNSNLTLNQLSPCLFSSWVLFWAFGFLCSCRLLTHSLIGLWLSFKRENCPQSCCLLSSIPPPAFKQTAHGNGFWQRLKLEEKLSVARVFIRVSYKN